MTRKCFDNEIVDVLLPKVSLEFRIKVTIMNSAVACLKQAKELTMKLFIGLLTIASVIGVITAGGPAGMHSPVFVKFVI